MSPLRLALTRLAAVAAVAVLSACGSDDDGGGGGNPGAGTPEAVAPGTRTTLALLETADLHSNVRSYDYFKLAEDQTMGFERVSTLIKQARAEFPNTLLLDNGDTIQGTALADYQAQVNPLKCGDTLAMYKVMNAAKFDGAGIGNHEFNYGLPFLNQITGSRFDLDGMPEPAAQTPCAGPTFPQVLANVHSVKSKAPLFQPYTIITKTLAATAPGGKAVTVPIKVGIIGFAPPAIMTWDKRWLDGKVYTVGARGGRRAVHPGNARQGRRSGGGDFARRPGRLGLLADDGERQLAPVEGRGRRRHADRAFAPDLPPIPTAPRPSSMRRVSTRPRAWSTACRR
ncbi:hypothetical protein OJJOAM_004647 [Cupriavidus sp. H18C1]